MSPEQSQHGGGRALDVTVAICAHNAAARLRRTMGALAAQRTTASWEVLVIDNASTDGTGALAASLGAEMGLPCGVVHEPEPGLTNARRRGAREARGRILSYVDDDNIVEPSWVEECAAFFSRHPRAGVVGGRIDPEFEVPGSEPPDFASRFAGALAIRDFGPEPLRLVPPQEDPPCGAGMTGLTDVFRTVMDGVGLRLGGRRGGQLNSGEDTETGLVAHRLGYELWYEPRLRMRHLLPARRLRYEYLDRLIVGGSTSTAWLNYLRGREPRRGRLAYAAAAARHGAHSAYLWLLGRVRRRGHKDSARYPVWAGIHFGTARGYWDLCVRNPGPALERAVEAARASGGGAGAERAVEPGREAVLAR